MQRDGTINCTINKIITQLVTVSKYLRILKTRWFAFVTLERDSFFGL